MIKINKILLDSENSVISTKQFERPETFGFYAKQAEAFWTGSRTISGRLESVAVEEGSVALIFRAEEMILDVE